MSEKRQGLIVDVLRPAKHRPGARLISDRFSQFVLIGEGIDASFTPTDDIPALRLVRKRGSGNTWSMHAEPFEGSGNLGFVPGGNWIWCGDSRLCKVPGGRGWPSTQSLAVLSGPTSDAYLGIASPRTLDVGK
jgi:hypothetical protein